MIRHAKAVAKDVMDALNYREESVSVAFEEVKSHNGLEKVYKPHMQGTSDKLYKKPG
jgi:4-oxalocrotonate tautomerase